MVFNQKRPMSSRGAQSPLMKNGIGFKHSPATSKESMPNHHPNTKTKFGRNNSSSAIGFGSNQSHNHQFNLHSYNDESSSIQYNA